jgi:hypothetical protein
MDKHGNSSVPFATQAKKIFREDEGFIYLAINRIALLY